MAKSLMNQFDEYSDNMYSPAQKAGTDIGNDGISSDNSGLNEDMLEQYGVWVKVEPEVITDDYIPNGYPDDSKSEMIDIDELPDDNFSFDDKKENLSFDDLDVPKEEEISDSFSEEEKELNVSFDEKDELKDDLESFDEELPDVTFEGLDADVAGEGINEDMEVDEPIDMGTEDIQLEAEQGHEEEIEAPLTNSEADFLGDMEDLSELEIGDISESETADAFADLQEEEVLPELETDDIMSELESEESLELPDEEIMEKAKQKNTDFELSDEESLETQEDIEVPLSDAAITEERFDDLDKIEKELKTTRNEEEKYSGGEKSSILLKIEQELLDIKKELSQIKSELANVRSPQKTAVYKEELPKIPETGGFFDEEEDETIALTGDELNNILNTADITEESTESGSLPDEELEIPDFGSDEKIEIQAGKQESVPVSKEKQLKQPAKREMPHESSVIDRIELEEIPLDESDISMAETSDNLSYVPEQESSEEDLIPREESDIDLEIKHDELDNIEEYGSDGEQEFQLEKLEEIETEEPMDAMSDTKDDIPLEEEIDIELDEEENKLVSMMETPESEQESIDEILGQDLESSEEIDLESQELESPKETDLEIVTDEFSEIEEMTPSKEDENEVVDGIDFDLSEEDNIIIDEEPSQFSDDIEIPAADEEFSDISELEIENADEMLNVESLTPVEIEKEAGVPGTEHIEENDLGEEVFEEVLPEENAVEDEILLEPEGEIPEAAEIVDTEDILEAEPLKDEDLVELSDIETENATEAFKESVSEDTSVDSLEIEEMLPEEETLDIETSDNLTIPELENAEEIPEIASGEEKVGPLGSKESESTKPNRPHHDGGTKSDLSLLPENLKGELKSVLLYLDRLLETLPEDKIEEFAKSDYFTTYKKLFEELGLAS
jgi:pilus assembly protein FimV